MNLQIRDILWSISSDALISQANLLLPFSSWHLYGPFDKYVWSVLFYFCVVLNIVDVLDLNLLYIGGLWLDYIDNTIFLWFISDCDLWRYLRIDLF